jgi:hypothetical protein
MAGIGAEEKYRWETTYFGFGVESRPSAERKSTAEKNDIFAPVSRVAHRL